MDFVDNTRERSTDPTRELFDEDSSHRGTLVLPAELKLVVGGVCLLCSVFLAAAVYRLGSVLDTSLEPMRERALLSQHPAWGEDRDEGGLQFHPHRASNDSWFCTLIGSFFSRNSRCDS